MTLVRVLQTLGHQGTIHEIGAELELEGDILAGCVERGVVELAEKVGGRGRSRASAPADTPGAAS